jgi:hypothetical protein
MKTAIQTVIEGYNHRKIQYVHIDPVFQGHRFCEEGYAWFEQINYGSRLHIWNSPARFWLTITNGTTTATY